MSGATGSSCSLAIVYPLDFARTRLSTDVGKGEAERKFKGLGDVLIKSAKADGVTALYNGFGISIVGIFIYRGCYFGFYDIANANFIDKLNMGDGIMLRLVKFGVANCVTTSAGIVSYPVDTVRRRM